MNERRCITLKVARRVRTAVPRGTASFPHFCDQIVLTLTRHIKLQNRKKGGLDGQRKFGLCVVKDSGSSFYGKNYRHPYN